VGMQLFLWVVWGMDAHGYLFFVANFGYDPLKLSHIFYLTFSHCLIYSKLSSMFTSANVNQKISRTKKMSNCTVFQIGEKIFSDQNHAKV